MEGTQVAKEDSNVYIVPKGRMPYYQPGSTLEGHQDEVLCVKAHKNKIYSSSVNGEIFVWGTNVRLFLCARLLTL